MITRSLLFLVALLPGVAVPISSAQSQPQQSATPPTMLAFDLNALDTSANACTDFYQFACGGWHKSNPMPLDESFWSRPFTQFSRQVEDYSRSLIEDAARPRLTRSVDERRIGDYYAACMDTLEIERRGLEPIVHELSLIDRMTSVAELPSVLGALHRTLPYSTNDGEPLLLVYATSDPVDGGQAVRLWISPSGIGLPGREYYIAADSAGIELREHYQAHLTKMFRLLNEPASKASRNAEAVLSLETALARAQLPDEVLRNDPSATSNPMTPVALQKLTPHFHWADFLRAQGIPTSQRINVTEPAYFEAVDSLLSSVPLGTWQAYLRSQLITERTKLLSSPFRLARFDFFGKTLRAQASIPERSRACIGHLKRDLPQALSRVFIDVAYRPSMQEQTVAMFDEIKEVFRTRIENSDWMESETKRQAFIKLDAVRLVVGKPEAWLDDQTVVIRRDDFYGNVQGIGLAARGIDLSGIGKPADINDWDDPATYIGAGYNSRLNAIFVTTGMMLYFSEQANDPAVQYGGLGHLLAHELIHGFDPNGRNFDSEGRLRDWWSEGDAARFDAGAQCVEEDFSALEYAAGIPVDGAFVVSEQVAELSAWSIASEAYQRAFSPPVMSSGTESSGKELSVVEFSPLQKYLITNAQVWCATATDGAWRAMANGATSKAWARPMVNGTVRNLPEFAEAFACREGQAMVKATDRVCSVW